MTVEELLGRMTARELNEWRAFYRLEPWGTEVEDLRAGIVASTVANALRSKQQQAFKATDFMPKYDRRPKSPAELLQKLKMFGGGSTGVMPRLRR